MESESHERVRDSSLPLADVLDEEKAEHDFVNHSDARPDLISAKPFNVQQLPMDCAGLIMGPRGAGKGYLFASLLFHKLRYDVPQWLVMTKTGVFSNEWPYFPKKYQIERFQPDVVQNAVDAQIAHVKRLMKQYRDMGIFDHWSKADELQDDFNLRIGLLGDDLMGEPGFHGHPVIESVYTIGRHTFFNPWMIGQHPKMLDPTIRGNSDYSFLFAFKNEVQRQAILTDFNIGGSVSESSLIYKRFLRKKHDCLVVRNTMRASAVEEEEEEENADLDIDTGEVTCWRYRAEPWPKKFVVGSAAYWERSGQKVPKGVELPQIRIASGTGEDSSALHKEHTGSDEPSETFAGRGAELPDNTGSGSRYPAISLS